MIWTMEKWTLKLKNPMLINYIQGVDRKLFSFHRHDYKSDGTFFIDGGFDYTRTNTEIHQGEIGDLIGDIRQQFEWINRLNEDGTHRTVPRRILLKDLETDHIIQILIHFTEHLAENINMDTYVGTQWKAYHLIFLYELKYRQQHDNSDLDTH